MQRRYPSHEALAQPPAIFPERDLTDVMSKAAINSLSTILPCPIINGSYTSNFCCSAQAGSTEAARGCCNTTLFQLSTGGLHYFGIEEGNSSNAITTKISTALASDTPPPTSTITHQNQTSPTQSPISTHAQTASKQPVVIGAGVGVPLVLISLSGLGFILWRRHRSHQHVANSQNDVQAASRRSSRNTQGAEQYEMRGRAAPQELEYTSNWPKELHSTPVQEAAEAF